MGRNMASLFLTLLCVGAPTDLSASAKPKPPGRRPTATWNGSLLMGSGYQDALQETAVLYFKIGAADVGKYVNVQTTADKPLSMFVVRGDRGGNKGPFSNHEDHLRVAMVVDPYINPTIEFQAFKAGKYTLVLKTNLNEAPHGMEVRYRINMATTSLAAARGCSIYMLESTFPTVFNVGDVDVNKDEFDFPSYQAGLNLVFDKYKQFMGAAYTKYGTTVGVDHPPEPYDWGGDASNPMNVKYYAPLTDILAPSVFTHELGHVFTQAYPFVYSFDGNTNLEQAANYLRDWLADPLGGGGLTAEKFVRHQMELMGTLGNISSGTPWHDCLNSDGFLLLVKNIEGDWDGIRSVFRSYSRNYKGDESDTDGYERARMFYLKLANSISDPEKRIAFFAQLSHWRVPFVRPVVATDADGDGFVAGVDPDDNNELINHATPEFLEDGIDNNQNGYVDELVLKRDGETIALGDDNTAYSHDRGTRRRLQIDAGKTLTVSVRSAKRVKIGVYKGNVYRTGPMWWHAAEYPRIAETEVMTDPLLWASITEGGVYTIDFEGYENDGVHIGDQVSYSFKLLNEGPSAFEEVR